ncbi:tellurite resistance/C4-dicarboxylate transporter family protein [Rhodovulum imhoffii]|uniref:tellurite resistance/C4-dicarboxylate transporter family protein n=1 Tax=Rhodovulum imhoffii TaxID=365340 RepID=UPI00147581FA|nr:tellurite resistance/C4-dicarboxylate transporter family protein [Rhodovulum imhoffii]
MQIIDCSAADLSPASFALVMATGSVSMAVHVMGGTRLSLALFALNGGFFVALLGLTALRLVRHRSRAAADLRDHGAAMGFFTTVVGVCVFAIQLARLGGQPGIASAFYVVAAGLWFFVNYAVLAALITARTKPTLRRGLNGLWLLAVVGAQAVAALGGTLAPEFPLQRELLLLASLVFFLVGCMLYIPIISLIFFRLVFVRLTPAEIGWPYWIGMGAAAITTLSGAMLAEQAGDVAILASFRPFLLGFSLFFWAVGTWWIPLLVVLGIWVHVVHRTPLRYGVQVWGIVFPLGMYTLSTEQLARAAELDLLARIPPVSVIAAVAVWSLACAGLLRHIVGLFGGSGDIASTKDAADDE